nr:inositol 3-kinase [Ipomoea batatas]
MSPNLPWGSSAVVPVLTTPAPVSVDLPVTEEPVPLAIESLPANILDTREPQQRGHGMQLRHMTHGTELTRTRSPFYDLSSRFELLSTWKRRRFLLLQPSIMVRGSQDPSSGRCLIVGNYCHDVLIKDDVVIAESLGGAASFISSVLDGFSVSSVYVSKVGSDFGYCMNHRPIVSSSSSQTTLFHAHFSSEIKHQDRVLKRVTACDPIYPSDLPDSEFEFGLAVGVGGEILPETLGRMVEICKTVFVDIQALIRVFDPSDGTVGLVELKKTGFFHLLPRIGFLKASSEEAPYVDIMEATKWCCVVVTNGKEGCTVYRKDRELQIAPFPTTQVDPTGAGDSFLGGLVAGLVHGLSVPEAALLGNLFGSLTVGQIGLSKFDSWQLQRVKDEILRRRLQSFGCQEKQAEDPNIVKTADLEMFHTALSAAKSVPAYSLQECKRDLPNSPRAKCSEQQRFLVHSVCEEPLKSVENKQ